MDGQIGGVHTIVLAVILNKCEYFDKLYVYPTQETLLEWVKKASGLKRCRRTINYVLLRLEKQGYIKRLQRHYNHKTLGHVFRSTLYELTKKGLRRLQWLGIPAFQIVKSIKRAVSGRPKKRPQPEDYGRGTEELSGIGETMKNIIGAFKRR